MKSETRDKLFAILILLVGIIFIVEASVVLYILGLFPPMILQMSQETAQFIAIGWGYGLLKILIGLIAIATGIAGLMGNK